MMLENLLSDDRLNVYITLGNVDTNISFQIGYMMLEDWRDVSQISDYPKMKFYREVGQLLGGKTDRMVSEYMRVAKIFPQDVMDDNLSFAVHSHCCQFENPLAILEIAQEQMAKTGHPPSLEWLRKATESQEQIEETRLVHEVEKAVLGGGSAFYFATELKRLVIAVRDKLQDVLGNVQTQELETHLEAIKRLLDEVEDN